MSSFKVVPIPHHIAKEIRAKLVDDQGHRLQATPAGQGVGPCRSCLKKFVPTDRRILFSYSPNAADNPYNEIGPLFIHENECVPYNGFDRFPLEIKNDKKNFPLTLRCYNKDKRMSHAEMVGERGVDEVIQNLFVNKDIEFIHARNAEYGCFIAKIERANAT